MPAADLADTMALKADRRITEGLVERCESAIDSAAETRPAGQSRADSCGLPPPGPRALNLQPA